MPVIEWVEALSVHVDELDEQHRGIIEVINDLHDALLHSKVTELDTARTKALDVMEEKVTSHFASEEAFMAQIDYPGLADHREEHHAFLKLLRRYKGDLQDEAILLNSELMKTLGNWFIDHELGEDQKYSSFYSDRTG
jgi:hemerythrin-like metal-binding protein